MILFQLRNFSYRVKEYDFYMAIKLDLDKNDSNFEQKLVKIKGSACRSCGLILPLSCMHVDHQAPKAGPKGGPIYKMLKLLGLRTEPSKGLKAIFLKNAIVTPPSFADKTNITKNLSLIGADLNPYGLIFLTVIYATNHITDLRDYCENSIINLAPRCVRCNTKKGKNHLAKVYKLGDPNTTKTVQLHNYIDDEDT